MSTPLHTAVVCTTHQEQEQEEQALALGYVLAGSSCIGRVQWQRTRQGTRLKVRCSLYTGGRASKQTRFPRSIRSSELQPSTLANATLYRTTAILNPERRAFPPTCPTLVITSSCTRPDQKPSLQYNNIIILFSTVHKKFLRFFILTPCTGGGVSRKTRCGYQGQQIRGTRYWQGAQKLKITSYSILFYF